LSALFAAHPAHDSGPAAEQAAFRAVLAMGMRADAITQPGRPSTTGHVWRWPKPLAARNVLHDLARAWDAEPEPTRIVCAPICERKVARAVPGRSGEQDRGRDADVQALDEAAHRHAHGPAAGASERLGDPAVLVAEHEPEARHVGEILGHEIAIGVGRDQLEAPLELGTRSW
jgi:hypothetical protein